MSTNTNIPAQPFPAPEGSIVYGEAVPLHVGRRTSVWPTRLTREDGKLLALVTQTQMVL